MLTGHHSTVEDCCQELVSSLLRRSSGKLIESFTARVIQLPPENVVEVHAQHAWPLD